MGFVHYDIYGKETGILMEVSTTINPGICGFDAVVTARSEDAQNVGFVFETDCETMKTLERQIQEISPVDAIMTLGPDENPILALSRKLLQSKGCCEACIVPAAAVKVMQVAANLALPKDVSMGIKKA
jgi:hypothetical protein